MNILLVLPVNSRVQILQYSNTHSKLFQFTRLRELTSDKQGPTQGQEQGVHREISRSPCGPVSAWENTAVVKLDATVVLGIRSSY